MELLVIVVVGVARVGIAPGKEGVVVEHQQLDDKLSRYQRCNRASRIVDLLLVLQIVSSTQ